MPRSYTFDSGELDKYEITQEGYLRAPVRFSRVGVMDYSEQGVKKVKLPTELFRPETIESMRGMPIVDEHPINDDTFIAVDSSNYKQYAKGSISEPRADGDFLSGIATVWDKELIEKIKNGKREVSFGYSKMDLDAPGEFEGNNFDIIQSNIIGNHLAITEKGRAGEMVRIEIDSAGKKINHKTGVHNMPKYIIEEKENSTFLTLRLKDGSDIQCDSEIHAEIMVSRNASKDLKIEADGLKTEKTTLENKIKDLEADKDPGEELKTATATIDRMKIEADAAGAKVTALEKKITDFDTVVEKKAQDFIKVLEDAKTLKIETDGKSIEAIKRDVISTNLDVDGHNLKAEEVEPYYNAALSIVRKKATDGDKTLEGDKGSGDVWKEREKKLEEFGASEKSS